MGLFKKVLIFLLVAGIISGGAYYFFIYKNQKKLFSGTNNNFVLQKQNSKTKQVKNNQLKSNVNLPGQAIEFIKTTAGNLENKTIENLTSAKSAADKISQDIKNNALGLVENSVNQAIDSAKEKLSISATSQNQSPIIGYSVKIGEKVYFFIKNPKDLNSASYTMSIDWGDGKKENYSISSQNQSVSHSWQNAGEYFVKFVIKAPAGDLDYSSLIMVKE